MRWLAYSLLSVVFVLAFAVEAGAQSGDWRISRSVDRVTGGTLTKIQLPSSKTVNSALLATPRGLLQFACRDGAPIVHLQLAFQVGSKSDSDVSYSFDGGPPRKVNARFLRGLKIVLIEHKGEMAAFLSGIEQARVLHLTIESLAKGRTSVEFRAAGAEAAIEALRAGCR